MIDVYELLIEDQSDGIDTVSLVDAPAIESKWMSFSSDLSQESQRFEFDLDEDRMIVTGPVLIPEKPIYRLDAHGEPYYVYVTAETIEKAMLKFAKEGYFTKTNVNHSGLPLDSNIMFESWITVKSDKAHYLGFEVPVGTWMASMKITDKEVWSKIKQGELNGFSIEGFFSPKKTDKNLFKSMFDKLKNLFKVEFKETNKVEFISTRLEDGTPIFVSEDSMVHILDEDGEIQGFAPEGTHVLENGTQIQVGPEGNLMVVTGEIEEAQEPVPEPTEEEVAEAEGEDEMPDDSDQSETEDEMPEEPEEPESEEERHPLAGEHVLDNGQTITVQPDGSVNYEDGLYRTQSGVWVMIISGNIGQVSGEVAEMIVRMRTEKEEMEEKFTKISEELTQKQQRIDELSAEPAEPKQTFSISADLPAWKRIQLAHQRNQKLKSC